MPPCTDLAKAAVWAALVRLFNWLMDEFLS